MHKGTTFSDSSFEALLSDEATENDHVVTSMHVSSQATWTSTFSALMTLKMVVAILNKEDAKDYVQAYQEAYNRDPIDVDIKDHLEHGAQPDEVFWLKPFETFKVCELFLKGVMLVDLVHASKYN